MGQIYSSTDEGICWEHLSDLAMYRVYDVAGLGDQLYAIYNDELDAPCRVAVTENGGATRHDVMTAPVQRAHLTWFQGKLLAASWDRTRLYAIGPASVEAYRLPAGCTIGVSYEPGTGYMDYNMLAAAQSYLYAILEDAAYWPPAVGIARSSDLRHFQWMTRDRRRLVSMEHWEDMDVIIAGGQGRDAALWKLDTYPFLEYLPALGR